MNVIKTIVQLSAYSSAMIISVMLLKAVFKNKIHLKLIIFLWMLVLLRLIIPFTASSPIHLDSLFELNKQSDESDVGAADVEIVENQMLDNDSLSENAELNFEDAYAATDGQQSNETTATFWNNIIKYIKSTAFWTYMAVIWAAGALIISAVNIINYIRFNRLIKGSSEARSFEIGHAVNKIKSMLKIKGEVKVIVSRHVESPVTFRIFNPVIILPLCFINRISKEKLHMILLHEFCHIKRKDIFYNVLWMAAKTIHWFNPLVWAAYSNYAEDVELLCDELVNSYLNKEQSFIYSQSLIDVIRLSKNQVNLPAAMSFCKDKSKLRKRVENMLNPKKKLKAAGGISLLTAAIMIVACFTTACQPTPQHAIEAAYVAEIGTETQAEIEAENGVQAETETQTLEENADTLKITDEIYNETETIRIDIDADVVPMSEQAVTIAQLEIYNFTDAEMERMVKVFFGGDVTYYDYLTSTKADYAQNIAFLQERLTLDDDELIVLYEEKDITDVDEIKAHINKVIGELEALEALAPENGEVIEKFERRPDEWGGFYADVDYGGNYLGYVSYSMPLAGRDTFSCKSAKDIPNINSVSISFSVDYENPEFEVSRGNAQDLIDRMEIEGVKLGDIFMAISGEDRYYVFCFERSVGERTIDYSFQDGAYTDDNEVAQTLAYEEIEVWTLDGEPVNFYWRNPHKVTEIINENADVQVDYNYALGLAVNEIFAKYAYIDDYDMGKVVYVHITGIEFDMVRVKLADTDYYISAPAWKVYGAVYWKDKQDGSNDIGEELSGEIDLSEYVCIAERMGPNIVTVNAMDGSIIDMSKGY